MEVEESFPDDKGKDDAHTAKITGNVTKDQLELYFETTRLSEGGAMKDVEEIERGVFLITFESEEAVQRVLNRAHMVGTEELKVCLYTDVTARLEAEDNKAEPGPLCTVVVRGVACIGNMDLLEMYFENTKKSGGGEIKEVKKDRRDAEVVYVTFEEEEVARRVVDRSHTIDGQELALMLLEPTAGAEVGTDPMCTVVVRGVSRVSNRRDVLEMYFESKKRSGGGEIEDIKTDDEDDDVVYITFLEERVAKTVASRPHVINNVTLEVSLYVPPNVPSEPMGRVRTIRVQMETPVSTDVLEMYFESKKRADGGDVECIVIDPYDACVAFVTFEEEDVAERVASRSHMIDGSQIEVSLWKPKRQQHVTACTIRVTGARNFQSTDPLQLYFESRKRSGGGDIVKIKRDEDDDDLVYVTYESVDVVKSVLERPRHRVNEQTLTVEVYVPGQ